MATLDFFYHISLISSWNEKCFRQTLYIKSKHTLLSSITLFESRSIYEILWNNTAEPGRPQVTMWRMRVACWIHKTTNTHSNYGINISFPLQQWLHERAYMSRYISRYMSRYISRYKSRYMSRICHVICTLPRLFPITNFVSRENFGLPLITQCSYQACTSDNGLKSSKGKDLRARVYPRKGQMLISNVHL